MTAVCLVEDIGRQGGGVVRAQQPPTTRVHEGEVEKGLVALTLGQLGGAAARPDGLADPAKCVPRRLGVDEVAPSRNDAGGVGADLLHVGELHPIGVCPELSAEHGDLGAADHDEHGLAGLQAATEKCERRTRELVLAGVEERLVGEGLPMPRRSRRGGGAHARFPKRAWATPPRRRGAAGPLPFSPPCRPRRALATASYFPGSTRGNKCPKTRNSRRAPRPRPPGAGSGGGAPTGAGCPPGRDRPTRLRPLDPVAPASLSS